jgi:hypothetical protein
MSSARTCRCAPLGHSVFHDGQRFNVYCFSNQADAETFSRRFGGEKFDPNQ